MIPDSRYRHAESVICNTYNGANFLSKANPVRKSGILTTGVALIVGYTSNPLSSELKCENIQVDMGPGINRRAKYMAVHVCLRNLQELKNEVQGVLRPDLCAMCCVYTGREGCSRTSEFDDLGMSPGPSAISFRVQMLVTCT